VLLDNSIASLVPAPAEGRRVVEGMLPILHLSLTRIGTVDIVILSALVVGELPIALRQASPVALWCVDVPSAFLALWTQPGPVSKESIGRRVAQFVFPQVLLCGGIAPLLSYGTLLLGPAQAGTPMAGSDRLPEKQRDDHPGRRGRHPDERRPDRSRRPSPAAEAPHDLPVGGDPRHQARQGNGRDAVEDGREHERADRVDATALRPSPMSVAPAITP
jgi:hypothetical protein